MANQFGAKRDSTNLTQEMQVAVKEMIDILGINHRTIIYHRQKAIEAHTQFGVPNDDEYATAIRFYQNDL